MHAWNGGGLLEIPAGDHRLHGVVGVVDGQGLQKPVKGTELAEEGLPAKTELVRMTLLTTMPCR